jgi:hypothetical protein
VGAACAALGHTQLQTSLTYAVIIGALFGLCFWWGFGERADSPGAGLIWGLGFVMGRFHRVQSELPERGHARFQRRGDDARARRSMRRGYPATVKALESQRGPSCSAVSCRPHIMRSTLKLLVSKMF